MRDELRNHFRPEFLNRVDDIIVFRPLSRSDLEQIVDLQLERLEQLLAERKLKLEVTPRGAASCWRSRATIRSYGARPLKRVIQRELQNPIALELLEGDFHEGDTIRVERDGHTPQAGAAVARSRSWRVRRGTPSPSDLAGMQAALRLARAASVREEVPVGAVIVADGDLLAEAHNETVHRHDPTAHAELLALQRALQRRRRTGCPSPRCTSRWSPAPSAPARSCWRRSAGSCSAPTTPAAGWRARSTTCSATRGSTTGRRWWAA